MLQIKNVRKEYKTGDFIQTALDDVSLNLRDNEFVAILGPSGSGKTTLLNIIGGLDRYDSGDLVINGVSTKKYKNRDWDSYRNHTVGFVFQSYNLIPHQTVLKNVELALTIGGISRSKRKQMALDALEQVGLRDQANKKPNQMSGGQMQRVAIARALVNNPRILLADEPTGALDTKTSIQVMELLKEVAKDRLVVMVTHNPELAEEYANRIVRLQDGKIISDTNPCEIEEEIPTVHKNLGKASMSLLTAFSLSLNNLLTKKGRTILTAFAGSIGIIGIALILAVSTGFQDYVDKIQEDTMTSYPLTITSESADIFSAILSMRSKEKEDVPENTLAEQQYISTMTDSLSTNDLKTFKKYLQDNEDKYVNDLKLLKYNYDVKPLIYTIDVTDKLVQINPSTALLTSGSSSAMSMMDGYSMGAFSEITDLKMLEESHELLSGRWPEKYDEVIAVVSDPSQISDLMLYSLGFRDSTEFRDIMKNIMSGVAVENKNEPMSITYDDLMNLDIRLVNPSSKYKYNEKYDIYEDMSGNDEFMHDVYEKSERLKVVGIACSTDNNGSASSGIFYLSDLTSHVIDEAKKSEIVKKQMENKDVDVFSGNKFDEKKTETGLNFNDMVSVDEDMLKNAFRVNGTMGNPVNEDQMKQIVMASANAVAANLESTTESMVTALNTVYKQVSEGVIQGYVSAFTITLPGTPTEENPQTEESSFLMINSGETYLPDVYKSQALSDAAINSMTENMDGLKISTNNLKKIVGEAFDSFISSLNVNPAGMVPREEVPEASVAADSAVANNSSVIYEEGANLATEYTSLLVAQGIGSAVGEVMAPVSKMFSGMGDMFSIDTDKFAKAFNFDMDEDELSRIMETMMSGSDTTYERNLLGLGYQDTDEPSSISFYFKDFESKGRFMEFLDKYNEKADDNTRLRYTDLTGLLMGSVETIINSVTYVLIAFVSISLVVSSIMIGIITYISVLERTKEIGILRAIGASKRNVSSIFNAETFIIGLISGLIGVGVSYLLLIPINYLIHTLTENNDITAVLHPISAVILVVIATILTIIGGLLPSRSAAKKDPVIALRTE